MVKKKKKDPDPMHNFDMGWAKGWTLTRHMPWRNKKKEAGVLWVVVFQRKKI